MDMLHKVCHYTKSLRPLTDSNGHNPLWGSPTQNSRGKLVEEDRYGLQLQNQEKNPTFIDHRAAEY